MEHCMCMIDETIFDGGVSPQKETTAFTVVSILN